MMGPRTMVVETMEAGGASLRRAILVLAAALVMAVMSVVSAPAAFAHDRLCTGIGWFLTPVSVGTSGDRDGDGYVCSKIRKGEVVYKDDHGAFGH